MVTLAGIMLLTVLLRLFFLHEPFERDEGMYAYFGQEILRGAIPYRDMIDHKPPGIHYLYALIIAVAGPTIEAIRIATALYSSLTTAAVYAVSRRAGGLSAGQVTAFLYAVFSGLPMLQGSSSNTEVFMVLPIIVSVYCYNRFLDTERRCYLSASGLSITTAILIKTVALPVALLIFLFVMTSPGKSGVKERSLDLLAFVVPPLLLVMSVLTYFYFHNALSDFYHWNITYNQQYGALSVERRLQNLRNSFDVIAEHGALWLVAIPASVWLIFIKRNRVSVLLGLLVPVSFAGVSMPGFYFPHYFIQMIAPLCIVSGVALASLYERFKSASRVVLSLFAAVACLFWSYYDYPYYFQYTAKEVSIDKYGPVFVNVENVANYLKLRIKPGEYVFQWGFEPELYFLTGTRSPNRFTFHHFVQDSNSSELYQSLVKRKPAYIIIQNWGALPGFTVLNEVMKQNYSFETKIGNFTLWRIKT